AETYLLQQHFPGNVRELRNMIERAITLSDDANIDVPHLHPAPLRANISNSIAMVSQSLQNPVATPQIVKKLPSEGLERYLESIEKDILLNALNMTHWNRTLAAKKLGMTFRSLRYRLKKFGLDTETEQEV
ncbi:MAG: helix-turn-helix domain-containing protein, partial [Acinetobacter sp.]|nr:helix-turn-helix domain-containing protein [Acinetobacter sp.]